MPISIYTYHSQDLTLTAVRAALTADVVLRGANKTSDEICLCDRVLNVDVLLVEVTSDADMQLISYLTSNSCAKVLAIGLDASLVLPALAAGANGFFKMTTSPRQLAFAIQSVSKGAAWLDESVAAAVFSRVVPEEPVEQKTSPVDQLSSREREILRLICKGLSNQKIAETIGISKDTVKCHIRSVFNKLLVSDRTQAAIIGLRYGIAS